MIDPRRRLDASADPLPQSDSDARLPRYQRLADVVRAEIADGAVKPGERLPSEGALASRYAVALGTVRQAIALLADEGMVERVQGRGTFVARPRFDNTLFRFFRMVDRHGEAIRPVGRVRSCRLKKGPAEAVRVFKTGREKLVHIDRVRCLPADENGDERIMLMESIWLDPDRFTQLTEKAPNDFDDLLYPLYESECGATVVNATETFTIDVAKASHAPLGIEPGAPIVVIERLATGYDKRPLEWRRSFADARTFRYQVELR